MAARMADRSLTRRQDIPAELTAERLRTLLSYDPETGRFSRIKALQGNAVGELSGYVDRDGYVILKVDYKNRKAHRLAWLYVHGAWPVGVIDHINGDKRDNRLANLRDATVAMNVQNVVAPMSTNTLGVRGVARAYGDWYRVHIMTNGIRQFVGRFRTIADADAAYREAKQRLHAVTRIK